MTIPLDNLYDYVNGLLPSPAIIYLFLPHGSKKLNDLRMLNNVSEPDNVILPNIICHDQEPLDYDRYTDSQYEVQEFCKQFDTWCSSTLGLEKFSFLPNQNLNLALQRYAGVPIYDRTILLHSEINSTQVQKYQTSGFECCYFWSHALIARDWYRFAIHDFRLHRPNYQKKFLIYNRGWTNSREYRLKFLELISQVDLLDDSYVNFARTDENQSYLEYQAHNSKMQVIDYDCFDQLPNNTNSSAASAAYTAEDFVNTRCSVILETLFDDQRIHITEKTLRAIACQHPFILAAGPRSLSYLRHYGFKTFEPYIDESYDVETDSYIRLQKIIHAMQKISALTGPALLDWQERVNEIARFNQQHFFNSEFSNIVVSELVSNLQTAFNNIGDPKGKQYLKHRQLLRAYKPDGYNAYLKRPNHRHKLTTLWERR